MERDWARLGAALRAARDALGLEQKTVADRIGVKRGALRNVERGEIARVTPTVRAYARVVRWTDQSVEDVLAGGSPTPLTAVEATVEQATTEVTMGDGTPDDLPLRIKAALASGHLLDTAVIELPAEDGEDPDAQMVVIVKGRQDASPERLHKALLQWERTEAQIRRGPA